MFLQMRSPVEIIVNDGNSAVLTENKGYMKLAPCLASEICVYLYTYTQTHQSPQE